MSGDHEVAEGAKSHQRIPLNGPPMAPLPVRQSRPLLRAIDLVQRESVQVSLATRQLMALAQRTLLEKVSPKQAVPDEVWRE